MSIELVVAGEAALSLPGLDGFAFVIGGDGEGATLINASFFVSERGVSARLDDVTVALRFPPTILKPVPETSGATPPPYAQVEVRGSVLFDESGDLRFEGFDALTLKPVMIGDSGVIISADDVKLDFSRSGTIPEIAAAGFDESFMGIFIGEAKVELPAGLPDAAPEDLVLRNCAIGSGGVSGRLEFHYTPSYDASTKTFSGRGSGTLFDVPFAIADVVLDVRQNAFLESRLTGSLVLPYFDERVDVELGFNLGGGFTARLTAGDGLLTLAKPGVFSLMVDSLGFRLDDGLFTAILSGRVRPDVAGLDWPTFEVNELAVDSNGDVRLEGGWLDLPSQYGLDFHGFQLEITKLGLGKGDDGGKWIGFSGGLKLVDELSAGASVEGLRLTWYDDGRPPAMTLNGVDVEFDLPGVLHFKGRVAYRELPGDVHRFDGSIKLELLALGLEIDGTLVIGTAPGHTFMAIYVDLERAAGLPLWSSGLALYGMAGLFALNMRPDKAPADPWYELGSTTDWYHHAPVGVTALQSKWTNEPGATALGAGVTIGTLADNGFAFSGRVLLVISFPGPVLLFQGAANLLRERSRLDEEPIFRALAVLDSRAGSFLIGLDAQYTYGSGGELIDVQGGVEAFYNLSDADAWHLYLGLNDPREKRIRAEIFRLFEANSYLMLDSHQLAFGAWVGYDKHWSFGPLMVDLEAWIEGNAQLSRKPVQLHGDLWLHGKAALSVFGFGTGLTVDARFAADVFYPFHVLAEFSVGINLPWPLPDFDADITLEWGPTPVDPPLPLPLQGIAIEHFKVTTGWPLPRDGALPLLRPNYNTDGDGFLQPPVPSVALQESAPPPDDAPVVPLDARPHLTFGRSVHDAALVGVNVQPVVPEWERIGDPEKDEGPVQVKYTLNEVALHDYDGSAWRLVARKAATANPPGVPELFGSWAPIPAMPDGGGQHAGQVKLWLWSKTAFDYTRHASSGWDEWFTDRFDDYPCVRIPPDRELCCDFERMNPAEEFPSPWRCPEDSKFEIAWIAPSLQSATVLSSGVDGLRHGLCFPGSEPGEFTRPVPNVVTITTPEPAKQVRVLVLPPTGAAVEARAVGFDDAGQQFGPFFAVNGVIDVVGADITTVQIRGARGFCIVRVCVTVGPDRAEVAVREEMLEHLREQLARWAQTGAVLQPDTRYRLQVVTSVETADAPIGNFEQTEFGYFRTEGPPGLAALSVPLGSPSPDEFRSGLDDLTSYVRQTVPATVPAPGEKPVLPRPVFRGYDVGIEFNEDYVDLMYRLGGRDLGFYLFDTNNEPIRDAEARLIALTNHWGRAEQLTLTESDKLWITLINGSDCVRLDASLVPHHNTLSPSDGQLLDPDTVYEGRLVPLLLHEAFDGYALGVTAIGSSGGLGRWMVLDSGANTGPSHWQVGEEGMPPDRFIAQTRNIWGGTVAGADPVKPGTLLLYGDSPALSATDQSQPGNWTDYRFSVLARSADDDAIGVVFRYQDADNYYRYSMDRERAYRRLVRVVGGMTTVLAEDDVAHALNRDYLFTVEAIGSRLRVYQDGVRLFSVIDASLGHGRIGLYCWASEGARFSDVRVDDYRAVAPVVYRFKFTTSRFANFVHLMHSFQDEVWRIALPGSVDVAPDIAAAVPPSVPPVPAADAESRAFDALAGVVLGPAAVRTPGDLQVTQVEQDGDVLGLLVQSPEPIDWTRTRIEMSHASRSLPPPAIPRSAKLTDVTFAEAQPNDESVSLLLRERFDLTGHRVECRHFPGPLAEPAGDPILFADNFGGHESGLLFHEAFGPNALDRYSIVDEGDQLGPSAWAVMSGRIVQTSSVFGGSVSASEPEKPGTLALTGASSWDDVRILVGLRSNNGAIGVVFRYQDADNYYRFSMDRSHNYRRLIRKVGAAVSVLWEDAAGYSAGQSYRLEIVAAGDQLVGYLDDVLLFRAGDAALRSGRVGLYCWANSDARFEGLTVESDEPGIVLWQPASSDLGEFRMVDDAGTIGGPSQWKLVDGRLTQSSSIHAMDATAHQPGTYALSSGAAWRDVNISVRLGSDTGGAIGVMLRYQDADNYYRFSMDSTAGYRRLIKKVGGAVSVLWEDGAGYTIGSSHDVVLRAVGGQLTGSLDGVAVFTRHDESLTWGQVAVYCAGNPDARFERLLVADASRVVGGWRVHDQSTAGAPSVWRRSGGALAQSAAIGGGAEPALPGTVATAGDRGWQDYRLAVSLRSDTDQGIGVLFRYQDDDNYYRFSMDRSRNHRRLISKVGGAVTTVWQDAGGYVVGQSTQVTIDVVGERLTVYLGETRLFSVADAALAAGQIGLYAWGNDGARFERVEVQRPPLEAHALFRDRFASGDTADWSFIDAGTASGPSNWTTFQGTLRQTSNIFTPPDDRDTIDKGGAHAMAGDATWSDVVVGVRLQSFDDDAIGLLFRYQDATHYYRFSMDRQRGYRRLVKDVGGVFTLLWEDDFAYDPGRSYELTVSAVGSTLRGFLDGVPMFVVDDGDVRSGRIGLYCWGNTDARFGDVWVYPESQRHRGWLLDDPFTVRAPGRWRSVDAGDQGGPSQWTVTAGELRQSSTLHGGDLDPAVPDKPGTSMIASVSTWTDYRLSVRLLSDTDQTIGVVFRYQDADNYYRFSMDQSASYRRLIKNVGGAVTTLWQDAGGYTVGREYLLTIDCQGSRLTAYLDGTELIGLDDADLLNGAVGLYCWANPAARFREVRVSPPVWTTFHRFGWEVPLPAGTRLRVFAGNAAQAPTDEPGVIRRFAASLDAVGLRHFSPAVGADLRLTPPTGAAGHARQFLPDSAYAPVAVRGLRSADGTGFFLLVPNGSPPGSRLAMGQYRVRLSYLRDNRAADPTSQLLSQAGESGPENVTLDIPVAAS